MYIPMWVRRTRKEWGRSDAKRDSICTEPETISILKDLNYREKEDADKWDLMDLYRPLAYEGKLPVIVSIHGGGFFYGDKEVYRFYCMDLATYGFAVINFNYHIAPEKRFPAPMEDANAVFTWLSRHADEYDLDKERVILIGDSAGAQMANQYAAIWSNPAYADLFGLQVPDVTIRGVNLSCGIYNIPEAFRKKDNVSVNYLGRKFDINDPRIHVEKFITDRYPDTSIFSAYHDFLREEMEPQASLLESCGVSVIKKVYGAPDRPEVGHVFQTNFALPETKAWKEEFSAWAHEKVG